jgi:ribosome modulation factor
MENERTEYEAARQEGMDAFEAGLSTWSCPYGEGDQYAGWRDGYDYAYFHKQG